MSAVKQKDCYTYRRPLPGILGECCNVSNLCPCNDLTYAIHMI